MKTIQYKVSYSNPHRQYIDFEAIFPVNGNQLTLQLPAWRPGRYELGNFAKNIQQWQATDANGNLLRANKVSKDSWTIEGIETDHVVIKYNYYSAELMTEPAATPFTIKDICPLLPSRRRNLASNVASPSGILTLDSRIVCLSKAL